MKKLLILFVFVFIFAGCSSDVNNDTFTIYTSFYGMYDFAKMIVGDKAEIKELIPSGVEAHDWEPGTGDMIALSSADVFIYSGLGMEPWVEKVLGSVENQELIVVEASEGIKALENNKATDPHVWLDPENALIQLENITKGISEADPENADYYASNFENVKVKIEEIDREFTVAAEGFSDDEIIVTHGAFGYLCNAYGLKQYIIEGLGGESDPSSAKIREIVDYINKNKKKAIFYVESEDGKIADMVSKETGAEKYALNPFENGTGEKNYFDVMRENLNNLKEALK